MGVTGFAAPAIGTRNAELSAASATARGVTVERVKVGPGVGYIVIDRSRGVQVGNRNRQLNKFSYRIERPHVSVDDLLSGSPGRLEAFARLVDAPDSAAANRAFRRQMSAKARSLGRVRFISRPAPRTTRVAARWDERGDVTVSRSQGVQVGSGNTQRNEFGYRVVKPEISLEPMLRDDPRLARAFALASRYPGNAAVRRSFAGRLASACAGPARSLRERSDRIGRMTGIEVDRAAGVQLGSRNIRQDRLELSIHRMVLTGWTRPEETKRPGGNRQPRPRGVRDPSPRGRVGRDWDDWVPYDRSGRTTSRPDRDDHRDRSDRDDDRDRSDRDDDRDRSDRDDHRDRFDPPDRAGPAEGRGGRF